MMYKLHQCFCIDCLFGCSIDCNLWLLDAIKLMLFQRSERRVESFGIPPPPATSRRVARFTPAKILIGVCGSCARSVILTPAMLLFAGSIPRYYVKARASGRAEYGFRAPREFDISFIIRCQRKISAEDDSQRFRGWCCSRLLLAGWSTRARNSAAFS